MITLLSAFVLTLGATAAPATAPEAPVVSLDPATALCLPSAPVDMARGGGDIPDPSAQAFCIAYCQDGTSRSCSGNSCSASDQNCPYTQGFVQCDGNYQYCPTCPPTCGPAQCRQQCSCPGGISVCDSLVECSCHCEFF